MGRRSNHTPLEVGARGSPLSQAQVREVHSELLAHHEGITFAPRWITTMGDRDLATPLRAVDHTDFFTRELDTLLLAGELDIAIHSAKDLPNPMPAGLCVVALTRGVDPRDVLLLRVGESLDTLPAGARVGTSSSRRGQAVAALREGLQHVDIRGSIEARLAQLAHGAIDALVIAEAALIRLNLTHLPRQFLEGETTPNQGRLAVVARSDDLEMKELFRCIST